RADAAMAERAGIGEPAQPADVLGRAAQMWAEPAMHGHAHELVDPIAGVVADGVLQQARGGGARAVQVAARQHHLVERGHGAARGIAGAAWRTALALFG